jgi:hypothetical protein
MVIDTKWPVKFHAFVTHLTECSNGLQHRSFACGRGLHKAIYCMCQTLRTLSHKSTRTIRVKPEFQPFGQFNFAKRHWGDHAKLVRLTKHDPCRKREVPYGSGIFV